MESVRLHLATAVPRLYIGPSELGHFFDIVEKIDVERDPLKKSAVERVSEAREEVRPPRPPRHLFTLRLIAAFNLLRRSGMLANRREFKLTEIERRIMTQVGEYSPLSLNELAEPLGHDHGQVSRTVKAMVKRGLLERRRKRGGPAIVITLSDVGRSLYERMMTLAAERNDFLVGDIPKDDIECADRVLGALMRKAQLLLERERTFFGDISNSVS